MHVSVLIQWVANVKSPGSSHLSALLSMVLALMLGSRQLGSNSSQHLIQTLPIS